MHARVMEDIGWEVMGKSGCKVFIRRLGPFSIGKIQRPEKIDLYYLSHLRKSQHILTLYLEPGLKHQGESKLGIATEPFAHSRTSLLDLSLSDKDLLASFNQNTRRNLSHASKNKSLSIESIELSDLNDKHRTEFLSLHDSWTKLRHTYGYPVNFMRAVLKNYAGHGHLHLAYENGVATALLLALYHDGVTTYHTAFSTEAGYKCAAPTLLTWTAIKSGKKVGCDILDFGGIYDPRYPKMYKNWQGFTKFKEGFRPTVVDYPPTSLKLFW